MQELDCPHCHMPITDPEALLCHFCGESLKRSSKGAIGKIRYGFHPLIWIVGVLIVILAFFGLMTI